MPIFIGRGAPRTLEHARAAAELPFLRGRSLMRLRSQAAGSAESDRPIFGAILDVVILIGRT